MRSNNSGKLTPATFAACGNKLVAAGGKIMSTETLTGGCLCGAVRYRTGLPTLPATICHCRSCRLAAGANAVGLYTVEKPTVAFTRGSPVEYRSSPKVLRGFCGSCGTALTYWEADWPTEFSLTIASLDDPGLVVPADHTWMAHAVPWDSPTDPLPQYQTDRP
jgi:hypothetical protein